jgi:hypothetical protein
MTPLQEEITKLSYLWMRFVGLDHHKDKDCHWYVEKYYSYGEPPYYQAFHWGYIGDNFEGSKCTTLEEAEEELRDNLLFQIHNAKIWVSRNLEEAKNTSPDAEYYFMGSVEEYQTMLNYLNGEFDA